MTNAFIGDTFNMNHGGERYWNESSWLSWNIPGRNINGFFYHFFRPNMNCLNGGPAMWDLSGEHTWDCLYWDWQYLRDLPEGIYGKDYNKFDYKAPSSMEVRLLEPAKRYHFMYDRQGFTMDLVFEGTAAPHPMDSGDHGKLNLSQKFHFEQPGRIKGTIELHGERHDVDCFGIRDGSHGRRFWGEVPTGGYTWSTASETSAWHFIAVDSENAHDTRVIGGYYQRDGVISSLVSGVRRIVERRGPMPTIIEIEARDKLGRELQAIGRIKVPALFHYYSDQVQWFSQFAWDYDGYVGAVGEDQEYYPAEAMRAWQRAAPSTWRTR